MGRLSALPAARPGRDHRRRGAAPFLSAAGAVDTGRRAGLLRTAGAGRARPRTGRQVVETDTGPEEGPPKAGSHRTVHLPPPGIDALDEHPRLRGPALPTARLFVRQNGTTLRAHHVHAAWSTARKRADLADAQLHDLHPAGLTLAAQGGATLAEVMRRAGHSSTRAAMIYQHAAERRNAEVAARLGRLAVGTSAIRTGTQWARRGR